jgi:PHP family Zn ribbon phosphoesterase
MKQITSKKVWEIYNILITNFGDEFKVLLDVSYEDLKKVIPEKMAKVIIMNREDKLKINPGADGMYGQVLLNKEDILKKQKSLSEF